MSHYHPEYDELITYLLKIMPEMPSGFPDLLISHLSDPIIYHSDTLVLKPGQTAILAYWPVKGYTRSYRLYKPEKDRELWKQKTIDISMPGKATLAEDSFMNQQPADFYMVIEQGSTMISFGYDSFIEMGRAMPEVYMLANRILATAKKDQQEQKEMSNMMRLEGYQAFLDYFDRKVESFVYQMHIASFIGMSPESLSRIRTAGGFRDEHLRK